MLKYLNGNQKNFEKKVKDNKKKRKIAQRKKSKNVKSIVQNVYKNGDKALIKYEKKFSNVKTNIRSIKFSKKEINKISKKIDKRLQKSINLAFDRIKTFHKKQKNISLQNER